MIIKSFCKAAPQKRVSEDSIVINEKLNVFGVFDGATPLVPFQDENGMNGAYLASNLFKDYFLRLYKSNLTLVEGIVNANRMLSERMDKYKVNQEIHEGLWSTCAAMIKVEEEGKISYAQLGDCMIMAEYQNGTIKALTRDTVKDISYRAKAWREELRKQGVNLPDEEYFQNRTNQLVFNRSLANKEYGYTVANGKEEVVNFIQHGQVTISEIKTLLLITDGLFHPKYSVEETFKKIQTIGLQAYSIELEQYEIRNNLRLDDKSGIMIRFCKEESST
ncbi:protein phosphatase 2C domain-containing protein [Neobacillus niacini]|uniref:protein phosphatase 2C domain-containing protein n=1 Tax=Neobacillus niacini TaxID=86668 RepID=UPI0007AC2139|nr:protein phosphatase 2C domain-containing protein [Neobacillus niacini]MEC1525336.1 protein phosphatase 2C domain-containing protein [Neobacillus niacini]